MEKITNLIILNKVTNNCAVSFSGDIKQPEQQPPTVEMKNSVDQIPADRVKAMQDYAVKLRKKYPHMKQDRIKRKVAEYFKIKLV